MQNSSELNGLKTETAGNHYEVNRTLRVRIVGGGPESLYLRAFPAPVPLDGIIISFLHLPVIRSGELIVCVISHAFRSRCHPARWSGALRLRHSPSPRC